MTYVYETLGKNPVRYEIVQSMRDNHLTNHPETGEPIRRVITGGCGFSCRQAPTPLHPNDYKDSKFAKKK